MEKILNHLEIPYKIGIGEAAFYGPKLDIQIKNVYGKGGHPHYHSDRPDAFGKIRMEYVDRDGTKKTYIIHRTSIGCYERTLALILEKYAGALPMWLSPEQVRVLPISEKFLDRADEITAALRLPAFARPATREARKSVIRFARPSLKKVNYMLIVGEKEVESGTVSVRSRDEGDLGSMELDAFIAKADEEIKTRKINKK